MHYWLAILSLLALTPTLKAEVTEEGVVRRVYGHLLIQDRGSAVEEAKKAIKSFPDSKAVQVCCIRALCEKGEETEAWQQWERGLKFFEPELKSRHMLEVIAWGVLNKAKNSSQLSIQVNSLLGAAFTRDVKAIPVLIGHLRSSNAFLRSIAVRLAASYGDEILSDELARMLKEEKVWYVRLQVIQVIGQMRIERLKPDLKEIVGNPKSLAEEKAAAIVALVQAYDTIGSQELEKLLTSDRAGLRHLGCEVIAHLDLTDQLYLMLPLLKDTSSDVRLAALNTLGLLRAKQVGKVRVIQAITPNLNDPSPAVAITAAWVALLLGEETGKLHMAKWLESGQPEWQRLASAAVAAAGKHGTRLAIQNMYRAEDPYTKVNLALGLIGQRVQTKWACRVIDEVFQSEKNTLWMWDQEHNPLFRSLAPSRVVHIEQIPHYPAVVDQMTRLDLLSVLSIVRYPHARETVRSFLQTQNWGVTGAAAATLLQEGDDEDLSAVSELLTDPDENIRVQAALILALVGSDPKAVPILQDAYASVDREMKVHILEALAHIGDPRSIPFLLEILKEPFQVLRVVAASALIQCLYH